MNKIEVTCYGKTFYFNTVSEAIRYFEVGMMNCDAFSSEWIRYADIVTQLQEGKTKVTDDYV